MFNETLTDDTKMTNDESNKMRHDIQVITYDKELNRYYSTQQFSKDNSNWFSAQNKSALLNKLRTLFESNVKEQFEKNRLRHFYIVTIPVAILLTVLCCWIQRSGESHWNQTDSPIVNNNIDMDFQDRTYN